jgi:hypothetical protein
VIAFGQGGALETIRGLDADKPTGVLFDQQTPSAVVEAIRTFEREQHRIQAVACRENAMRFGLERFHREFFEHATAQWDLFRSQAFRPARRSSAAETTGAAASDPPPYEPRQAA